MPLYSLMIATEPLPPAFWQEVGWQGHETFGDGRHLIIYAMRTADDRIAIGGRGAPYHFGSRVLDSFDREPAVFAALREVTRELFPALGTARFTHTWGGPIGVPRDWFSSVGLDKTQAWAGQALRRRRRLDHQPRRPHAVRPHRRQRQATSPTWRGWAITRRSGSLSRCVGWR